MISDEQLSDLQRQLDSDHFGSISRKAASDLIAEVRRLKARERMRDNSTCIDCELTAERVRPLAEYINELCELDMPTTQEREAHRAILGYIKEQGWAE